MADLHRELLEQARHLATREPRRPRQASLRRAVSAAYYALFHALAAEFARAFPTAVRPAAGRLLEHGPAVDIAGKIRDGQAVYAMGRTTCPGTLRTVADDFIRLQKARANADYDVAFVFTRSDVLGHVQRAERAVREIGTARAVCPVELQAFLLALVGGSHLHRRLKP